ncbi:MAG: hypothetical protein EKK29_11060 [Hyphomicrobiales bacterium]|nr:MAG: hypothetical protein EKK29_11060 [Hyphomicrobiales bacterium]
MACVQQFDYARDAVHPPSSRHSSPCDASGGVTITGLGAGASLVFGRCEVVIVGTGQHDNVRLSPEASEYLSKKGCAVLLQPTPEAIHSFNEMRKRKVGLMHVTC